MAKMNHQFFMTEETNKNAENLLRLLDYLIISH